jgi:peptide-methionine (S)-S-oxide reductase
MKPRILSAVAVAAALLAAGSAPAASGLKTAVFAGGCFWSMEKAMEHVPGVRDVVSGYAGGRSSHPTYENHEGFLEAVKVTYDPAKISYGALVNAYFHNIDPTDPNGQICDRGPSYRTAVFVADPAERTTAEAVKRKIGETLDQSVATEIRNAAPFYMAEAYHQDYARRNPVQYNAYRMGCGRDRALKAVWGGR